MVLRASHRGVAGRARSQVLQLLARSEVLQLLFSWSCAPVTVESPGGPPQVAVAHGAAAEPVAAPAGAAARQRPARVRCLPSRPPPPPPGQKDLTRYATREPPAGASKARLPVCSPAAGATSSDRCPALSRPLPPLPPPSRIRPPRAPPRPSDPPAHPPAHIPVRARLLARPDLPVRPPPSPPTHASRRPPPPLNAHRPSSPSPPPPRCPGPPVHFHLPPPPSRTLLPPAHASTPMGPMRPPARARARTHGLSLSLSLSLSVCLSLSLSHTHTHAHTHSGAGASRGRHRGGDAPDRRGVRLCGSGQLQAIQIVLKFRLSRQFISPPPPTPSSCSPSPSSSFARAHAHTHAQGRWLPRLSAEGGPLPRNAIIPPGRPSRRWALTFAEEWV